MRRKQKKQPSEATTIAGNLDKVATWLEFDIEQTDVRQGREFVVPFQDATGWQDEWSDPNYLPPNGVIQLRRVETDEYVERTIVKVYGMRCVWLDGQTSPPDPQIIETPLYIFNMVGVRDGETEVRYVADVDRLSRSMQHYPEEVIERLKTRFGEANRQAVHAASPNEAATPAGRGDISPARGGGVPREERPEWPEQMEKARKYWKLRSTGRYNVAVAAGLAGFNSSRTAKRVIETMRSLGESLDE